MNNSEESLKAMPQWAFSWEPRAKLIAAIIYIFGVISLTTPLFAGIAYMLAVMTVLLMGIPLIVLLKRYLIITPFLLLMTVPLLFDDAGDHLSFATLIIVKAFTSMTVITILLDSQTPEQFMNSLAGLKIPPVVITVLVHSFRYVYLFLDDIQKLQLAAKSRLFQGGISLQKLKIYGQLTATLLIKSLNRSDRVYEAMASRCFTGTLPLKYSRKITTADLVKTTFVGVVIIGLIVFEKV
ncbi:energy-coupling factor transporter transmembrane component T [Bacillus sp. B15-48]|uniref:energy-coupling factor transporter transmembrane component T family protein n=1 Tax=Bacillus sp. B15-48 TaxID=1548601 RepID=UPI00193ED6A4|nr:energy-coupling factor transporter transmembrane component T [Bacillus sp. B15-48]MBM4761483.1 hypothetical protein [Bacillus sp. B15-48]